MSLPQKTFRRRTARGIAIMLFIAIVAMIGVFDPSHQASAAVANWQKGVDMVSGSNTDYGSANFQQSVKNAKSIGANYITLNIPLYQTSVSTTDIQTGGATPTDAALESAISFIHAQGMHVMLKFQLFPNDGSWSADVNPSDRTTWFNNYGGFIDHYATIAQSLGVEQICLGTELIDMTAADANPTNTQNWETLIGNVRKIYSGSLTYDANWGGSTADNEPARIQFWGALDLISISAYFNLSGDGSVSSLMQSWDQWNTSNITPLEQKWNKPVIFGEVGYRSIFDSYTHPWMWWESGNADPAQQANDYQALFQYWNNYPWLAGVDFWDWTTDPNAGGPNDNNYTPQNKTTQSVMQTWFSGGSGPGSGTSTTPIFSASATANPAAPAPGQPVSFAVGVSDAKAAASNVTVDTEIYNAAGAQVYQKTFTGQNFTAGQTTNYTLSWTPPASGSYTLKTGVFSSDWQTLYYWNNQTLGFTAASTPTSGIVDVWWPTNGSSVSGVQPFQAMLENASVDTYTMFWQVDGGQLNAMATNNASYPHKQADVDVSPWNWNSSGNYTVTFVAQNLNGATIAKSSATIKVTH